MPPRRSGMHNKIFEFPSFITCELRFIDVSITAVGLISTKLWWFQHFGISQNSISIFFWKANQIFVFPCCRTRKCKYLSIDVSTRCRPSKRRRCNPDIVIYIGDLALQHKSNYKSELNFDLFWKGNKIFGFPCSSTRENHSIDVSIN